MKIRTIKSYKRIAATDAEKYELVVVLHVSQEELNSLKEKGLVSLLGGKTDGN